MFNYEEFKDEIESSSTVETEAADLINSSLDMAVGTVDFEDRELLVVHDFTEDDDGLAYGEATVIGLWSAPALGDLADGVTVGNSATALVSFARDMSNNYTFSVVSVDPQEPFDEDDEYDEEGLRKLKWDKRFFDLAKHVSGWSKDPKAKVGAIVVNSYGETIALGYNGFPKDVEDDLPRLSNSDLKNEMVVHAEQNALLISGSHARGGTIYVYGKPVCPRCAVLIIQAGVKRVVGIQPDPIKNPDSDTHRRGILSLEMFKEAKVEFSPAPHLED